MTRLLLRFSAFVFLFTLVPEFAVGRTGDGEHPYGELAVSGSTLFGTTVGGGNGLGTVFSVNADGTGYKLLRKFGGYADGRGVYAGLTISSSTLFGAAFRGGSFDRGTIFSMYTDGSGFSLLHEFKGNDAISPIAGLIISGSTLFSTTEHGGNDNRGTVFSINTDGTDFRVLHKFAADRSDGDSPAAELTLNGSTLIGTTEFGGSGSTCTSVGCGAVFSINTDGAGFTLLHEFAGGVNEGRLPRSGLTLSGSSLFGTTRGGGDDDRGTIYAMNIDGTGFRLLHKFAGGTDDGMIPYAGGLTLSGSKLFGTTAQGGDFNHGTIFSINTDGTNYKLLHEFAGGGDDGNYPYARLSLSGTTLFGTTVYGGDFDRGTVFSLNTDGTSFKLLHEFAGIPPVVPEPNAIVLALVGLSMIGLRIARKPD